MCFSKPAAQAGESPTSGIPYTCDRLNDSTSLIVHNDKYLEFPYIYVKLYPELSLAVVIDTGCGAHNGNDGTAPRELRDYILSDVLNSEQKNFSFTVICTHCHFDHIGGIEAFSKSGASIVASGYDRDFLRPDQRETNSLCGAFGMETPEYEITQYAKNGEELQHNGRDLGLRILHTPGHTPDSMAIYDEAERWLYVGDTCYKRLARSDSDNDQGVPIILPLQGNWRDFIATLHKLQRFVTEAEEPLAGDGTKKQIQLAAGHTTSQSPAKDFVPRVIGFCEDVEGGKVPSVGVPGDVVAPGGSLGDVMFRHWQAEGRPEFALRMPESFMDDFRREASESRA